VGAGRRPGMTLPPPPPGLFTSDATKASLYELNMRRSTKSGIRPKRVGGGAPRHPSGLDGLDARAAKERPNKMYSMHAPPSPPPPKGRTSKLGSDHINTKAAAAAAGSKSKRSSGRVPKGALPLGATAANLAAREAHREHFRRRVEAGYVPPPPQRRDRSLEKERLWIQPRKERCDPYSDRDRKPAWYDAYQGRDQPLVRRVVRVQPQQQQPNPHKGATAAAAANVGARRGSGAGASPSSVVQGQQRQRLPSRGGGSAAVSKAEARKGASGGDDDYYYDDDEEEEEEDERGREREDEAEVKQQIHDEEEEEEEAEEEELFDEVGFTS
jgi:hypothetical protein